MSKAKKSKRFEEPTDSEVERMFSVSDSDSDLEAVAPKPKKKQKKKYVQKYKSDESKQSQYKGVNWNKKAAKWRGVTYDVLADRSKSKAKRNHAMSVITKYFDDEHECYQALQALKTQIDDKNNAIWVDQASKDPLTSNVERAPNDIRETERGVAYWRPNQNNNQLPNRMVAMEDKSNKKTGLEWYLCCQHVDDATGVGDCSNTALSFVKGQHVQYCFAHTEVKAYSCDVQGCEYTCKTEAHLKEHKRCVHKGELAHPCKSTTGQDGHCPNGVSGFSKYDMYCVRCFISKFPNDPRSTNAKAYLHAKELTVRE